MSLRARTATFAWLITAVYYFYQYVLRSAPAVMMPQLSEAFGVSTMATASIVGLFYYGYSPFSLVAGAGAAAVGDFTEKVTLARRRSSIRRRAVSSPGGA